MKKIVEFQLENLNESVLVEVNLSDERPEESEVSRISDLTQKASQSFQNALSIAKPVAETIISKLGHLSQRPDEVEVEFGLKLTANAGAIISSTGVDANFRVTLKWKPEKENV